MADQDLEIVIRTLADTHGVEKIQSELTKLNTTVADAGKQVGWLSGQKMQLRQAMRALSFEFPVLGKFTRLIFNPWTAALAGIILLTKKVREESARLDEWAKSFAGKIGNIAEEKRKVMLESILEDKPNKEAISEAEEAMERRIELINNLAAALERLGIDEEKRVEFIEKKETSAREEEFQRLMDEKTRAEEEAKILGGGRTEADIKAKLADTRTVISDSERQIAEQKAKIAENQPGEFRKWANWLAPWLRYFEPTTAEKEAAIASAQKTIDRLKDVRARSLLDQEQFLGAQAAFARAGEFGQSAKRQSVELQRIRDRKARRIAHQALSGERLDAQVAGLITGEPVDQATADRMFEVVRNNQMVKMDFMDRLLKALENNKVALDRLTMRVKAVETTKHN